MSNVFAFESTLWDSLVGALNDNVETAAVIIARTATTDETLTLLGRRVIWVPDSGYARREPYRLEIKSTGYVPALGAAERDGGVAVFVHTHPGGDPSPSELDEEVDRQVAELFRLRTRQPYYVSLILGGSAEDPLFTGRIFEEGSAGPIPVDRIRVCGKRLSLLTISGSSTPSSAQFDRQILAFGTRGQAVLTGMRVGVVGAGGTGSAVCEQLVRLGVGSLTVVDDDVIDVSNLSRLHEATQSDVGTPKVDLIKRRAREVRETVKIGAVNARLRTEAVCRRLLDCDVIFGCTDDAFGRSVLSRMAYWYLIPVIDMGFVIDARDGGIRGLFGRVTVLEPGSACLLCRGRLSPQEIALEAMSSSERIERAQEGYAPGLHEPDPSVVTYTTLVGSLAVGEMLARLFRIGEPPPSELIIRVADRSISRNSTPGLPDHYCVDQGRWGLGDEEPMLSQLWPS